MVDKVKTASEVLTEDVISKIAEENDVSVDLVKKVADTVIVHGIFFGPIRCVWACFRAYTCIGPIRRVRYAIKCAICKVMGYAAKS